MPSHPHHNVQSPVRRSRLFALLMLSLPLFIIASPLQAIWEDSEYADLFANAPKTRSASPETVTSGAAEDADALHQADEKPQYSYTTSDPAATLHPTVSPLDAVSMHNQSIRRSIEKYRPASRQENLKQIYKTNRYKNLWSRKGRVNGDARAVMQILADAAAHGLNPADYHVDEIRRAQQRGDMTLFDLLLTDNALGYVSHLRDGQFSKEDVDPQWEIRTDSRPDLTEGLAQAIKRKDAPRFMKLAAPRHPIYRDLQRHLAEYNAIAASGGWPSFPVRGGVLSPGASGSEVQALRSRLAVTDGADLFVPQSSRFDNDLKLALQRFQRRHGLNDDGVVGGRTRQALAASVNKRIQQLATAMERWRWMPQNIGKEAIIVNVPAFRLWYWKNGVDQLTMRIIVGQAKKDWQTPTFTRQLEYMVLNPNWNVPNSIVSEEMAPKASQNPGYFQEKGYRVIDDAGNIVDPASVNWAQYSKDNPVPYRVIQARGGDGALGLVKFIFPNHYGVALHDTQSRDLFNEEFRAFSHGCIRVEKPLELGAALLGQRSPQHFSALVEKSAHDHVITIDQNTPVFVVYMTAWADANEVYFYEDLYHRDRRLVQAKAPKRG